MMTLFHYTSICHYTYVALRYVARTFKGGAITKSRIFYIKLSNSDDLTRTKKTLQNFNILEGKENTENGYILPLLCKNNGGEGDGINHGQINYDSN